MTQSTTKRLRFSSQAICQLLIEGNDPFLKALGSSDSSTFASNFTFTNENGYWKVSGDFDKEFRTAIAQGRLDAVQGK